MFAVDNYQTKKLFTIEELVNMEIDVPDIQRSPDDDRISEIIDFQVQHYRKTGTYCFLGELTMYSSHTQSTNNDGQQQTNASSWLIIDGMHRYLAMKSPLIYEVLPTYKICVNIIKGSSSLTLDQAFLLINKARPVPSYVIETTLEKSKRRNIDDVRRFIMKEYKHYLSKAENPRLPNFNLDSFLSCLVKSPMLSLLPSSDAMMGYIKFANIKLKDAEPPNSRIKKAINQKCEKLSLGSTAAAYFATDTRFEWMMNKNWIKQYINEKNGNNNENIENNNMTDKQSSHNENKRKVLNKVMRQKIWCRYYGRNMDGICKCCRMNKISVMDYDAGHILAHKEGGSSYINNFVPICRPCNQSMGTENMNAFLKKMDGDNVSTWLYNGDDNVNMNVDDAFTIAENDKNQDDDSRKIKKIKRIKLPEKMEIDDHDEYLVDLL